jgi:hypothetical protein
MTVVSLDVLLKGMIVNPTSETTPNNLCLDAAYVGKEQVAKVNGFVPHIRPRGEMKRSATLRKLSPKERKSFDKCVHYLLNKKPYLRHDRYLAKGLPIAKGVIEGACRHLVKDRMDLIGACWGLTGAEAVPRSRALRSSHDLDEYWIYHEQCEYERNHKSLYKDDVVPIINNSPLPRQVPLRVVE